ARWTAAATVLEADRRPVIRRVGNADVVHDQIAGEMLERALFREAAGSTGDDESLCCADLQLRHPRGHRDRLAAGRERVARFEVQHRRLRRSLVRAGIGGW